MRKQYFCLLCLALSLCPRPPPLLPQHITTPDTAKLIKMATFFHNRWRKPQCIGATEEASSLSLHPMDYLNKKRWHSIVLQGVVYGKGLFWDVFVGYAGNVYDTGVLRQSHLWDPLNDNTRERSA